MVTLGRAFTALLLALSLAAPAASQDALPDATEIARRVNARDEGVTSSRRIVMELIDKSGHTRTRETVFFRRYVTVEDGPDEKWLVLFYLSPGSIKDTAFLTRDFLESKQEDEQWLYLPAIRRSRRIALRDRGKSFLGTDLSYDDVRNETKLTISDYTWKTLREDTVDEKPCIVIEATPIDDETGRLLGYGRVEFAIDPTIWMVRRGEYWDPSGRHLKTSRQSEIREVEGIWTPHLVEVANHRTRHHTRFTYSDVRYGVELADDLFTERALRRGPPN